MELLGMGFLGGYGALTLASFGEQLTAYQHAADLAGTGADLVQLGITPQA